MKTDGGTAARNSGSIVFMGFLALRSNKKLFLVERKKKVGPA
jgi:hypothetical protein